MKGYQFILWLILFSNVVVAGDTLKYGFALESWNDIVNNISGGIKRGTVYKGLLAFDPNIRYGKFGFKGSMCYSFGKSPSEELIGDMHVMSNIDADVGWFIFESYFFVESKKFKGEIGILNMNEQFVMCENAQYLLNSSFGIPSHITHNTPVSVYPLTTLGANFIKEFKNKFFLKLGIYDGFPDHKISNRLSTAIQLNDGYFVIGEAAKYWENIHFKMGSYYHSGKKSDIDSSLDLKAHQGFYSIIYKDLFKNEKYHLSLFSQLSKSLHVHHYHNYYVGGGITLELCKKENTSQFSLGIAHAGDKRKYLEETVVELNYYRNIGKYIFIQPDIQYIINPSGTGRRLENAFTVNLRLLLRLEKSY
ncbi:MAG: carbohydrate porin [Bacteroidales bacterium]|nr:carbohydrate porin [Bacteroidales bacterium]